MHHRDIIHHLDALIEEATDAKFADRLKRLRSLVLDHPNEELSVAAIYEHVFDSTKAESSKRVQFSEFRKQIGIASESSGRRFSLIKPDLRGKANDEIFCRFEGGSMAQQAAEDRFTAEAVSQIERMDLVEPEVYATTGSELEAKATGKGKTKPLVKFFVSYAHNDDALFEKLLVPLEKDLKLSKDYRFEVWIDRHIPLGADWFESIKAALDECDFGLLMVSREFLTSEFIIAEELKTLVDDGKPLIPVALGKVHFDREMKGLAERQFYQLEETGKTPRAFSECHGAAVKDRFIAGLVRKIEDDIASHQPAPAKPKGIERERRPDLQAFGDATFDDADFPEAEIDPEAATGLSLEEHGRRVTKAKADEDPFAGLRTKAVDYLIDWFEDPSEPPVAAVLGEIGSGKTTMLMMLARALGEKRKRDPDLPPVIFVDLRNYQREEEGLLENILADLIRRHWTGDAGRELTPADIIRCVQEEGGLIIFDGLDEKIIPLSEQKRVAFIHELWRVLPPRVVDRAGGRKGRGRMIISCRSHYFPNVISQNEAFTEGGRSGVKPKDYAACVMLPWRKEQIDEYLAKVVGEDKVSAAQEIIASIHNLSDLAPRPYLLSLIAPHLAELELKRAAGEKVNGASLYKIFVEQWLARDTGKHLFTPEHKLQMMGALAWHLHSKNLRELPWSKVAEWLDQFLLDHPAVAARYQREAVSAEMLNQDFRTATFFLRPDKEKENFRFAHTSLQEYFLACYLVRALEDREQTAAAWTIPLPSNETLRFVGQLFEFGDANLSRLADILDDGDAAQEARRPALRYWMIAAANRWPVPRPKAARLGGLDLEDWTLRDMDLAGASLSGSNLRGAKIIDCDLSRTDWQNVYAAAAEFLRSPANKSQWQGATLSWALWRHSSIAGADLIGADTYECALIESEADLAKMDEHWQLQASATHCPPRSPATLVPKKNYLDWVFACAFSPDGFCIASASNGEISSVQHAITGEPLLALKGQSRHIITCAFSPDGAHVASASDDGTLRLWEAATGRSAFALESQSGKVTACAFSPDGAHMASASGDGTLQVWDAATAQSLLTLEGNSDPVTACAFSPDGARIVSGSRDGTLRLWDVATGKTLHILEGHSGPVTACAFSPDAARIASASNDGTLRVWDAASRRQLVSVDRHSDSVRACVFSPDGTLVVSVSEDGPLHSLDVSTGRPKMTYSGITSKYWLGVTAFYEGRTNSSYMYSDKSLPNDARSASVIDPFQGILSCAFSHAGARVASASCDGRLRVWDATTGKSLLELNSHSHGVAAFSPDGARVVSGSIDNTLRVWDFATGTSVLALEGHSSSVTACAFSPDGGRIASASRDNTLRVWDSTTGRSVFALNGHSDVVSACAFSPDGGRLASASGDNTLRVWDAVSGNTLLTLVGHTSPVSACAFSPDGGRLASASEGGDLRVWDVVSANPLLAIEGQSGSVSACVFSPDGRSIASASHDLILHLWDAVSGNHLLALEGHTGPVTACAFSPGGNRIASASSDDTLRLWDAHTGKLLRTWVGAGGPEYAFVDFENNKILGASPEGWRLLGWRYFDEEAGRLRVAPAEIYGPLPPL